MFGLLALTEVCREAIIRHLKFRQVLGLSVTTSSRNQITSDRFIINFSDRMIIRALDNVDDFYTEVKTLFLFTHDDKHRILATHILSLEEEEVCIIALAAYMMHYIRQLNIEKESRFYHYIVNTVKRVFNNNSLKEFRLRTNEVLTMNSLNMDAFEIKYNEFLSLFDN